MPLIELSKVPSRAELREAHRQLKVLAQCKVLGAGEELEAVSRLLRELHPVVVEDLAEVKAKRARRKRRATMIGPEHCMGPCPSCKGRSMLWPADGCKGRAQPVACHWPRCAWCGGSGWLPVGAAEQDPVDTLLNGRRARGERLIRGEFAPQTPSGEQPAPCLLVGESRVPCAIERGTAQTHIRGSIGYRLLGRASPAEIGERLAFRRSSRKPGNVPRTSDPRSCADDIDVLAALEGRMAVALRDLEGERIMGRRLLKKSNRQPENIPRPGERRAKTDRRIKKYQRQLDRELGQSGGTDCAQRPPKMTRSMRRVLERLGVDVEALLKQAEPLPTPESRATVEGMRRGDLPPDPMPAPHADEFNLVIDWGLFAGRPGHALAVGPAYVLRRSGQFERVPRALRVTFADGQVEMVAAQDVGAP